jgi:drug/metabolite transporter (DMT)-like permease
MDLLLLLMAVIWGSNFSVIKAALEVMPARAFNAARLLIASILFLAALGVARRARGPSVFYTPAPLDGPDRLALVGLGVVGHFLYQLLFVGGLERTSVTNSSLILAVTPAAVALVAAARGEERVTRRQWAGVALSIAGVYVIAASGAPGGRASLAGDLLTIGAVACWTIYTIWGGALMLRHSPLGVTGLSMAIGTALYVPAAWDDLRRVDWARLGPWTWAALAYSAVFALCVAYMIWYVAVQRLGSTRTAIYSNLVPIVALAVAVLWRGEPLGAAKIAGAALVLFGVGLARVPRAAECPPEE